MPFRAIKLVLLTLVVRQVNAQIPEILTTSSYKRGIYKNYAEFLTNNPSITDRFLVGTRSSEKAIEKDKGAYHLILIDSAIRRRDLKYIWGFSDGESIYANEVMITGSIVFRKFTGIGRYCYLQASPPTTIFISPNPIAAVVATAVVNAATGYNPYILNLNNGRFFLLDKKVLTMILQKDPELLAEYQSAERRSKDLTLLNFVDRYNERHRDEADASLWFDRELVLYRLIKKEVEDTAKIIMNDTLVLALAPGQVHTLKIHGDRVNICSAGGECKVIPLHRKGGTYVSISQRKKDDALIRESTSDEAKFFLKESVD